MVWDARQQAPSLVLNAHPREILTGDWCKYNDCVLATGSIDKSIKVRSVYCKPMPRVSLRMSLALNRELLQLDVSVWSWCAGVGHPEPRHADGGAAGPWLSCAQAIFLATRSHAVALVLL